MDTTKLLIELILRSNIPYQNKKQAVTNLHQMSLHPNRNVVYGFDNNTNDYLKLFCWDRAIGGALFWIDIFKHIEYDKTKKVETSA